MVNKGEGLFLGLKINGKTLSSFIIIMRVIIKVLLLSLVLQTERGIRTKGRDGSHPILFNNPPQCKQKWRERKHKKKGRKERENDIG